MNDAQLKAKLKSGQPGKFTADRGLYFRVSEEGNGCATASMTKDGSSSSLAMVARQRV